jgi:hypothetical protein
VAVHKDAKVGITGDHPNRLANLLGIHAQVPPRALHIPRQLFEVIFDKIYLTVIALLDTVEDWPVRCVKHVDGEVQPRETPLVLVLGDVRFVLERSQFLILDAAVGLVIEESRPIGSSNRSQIKTVSHSSSLLILQLMLLKGVHLIVVVFLGKEHGRSFLMKGVPELRPLLDQLMICRLIVLIIELQGLDQISVDHLRLLIQAFNNVVNAAFHVDKSCAQRVYDV